VDASTLAGGEGQPAPPAVGMGVDTGRAWPGLAPLPVRRTKEAEPEPHPWPASGRVGGRDGPAARAFDVDEIIARPAVGPPAADPDQPSLTPLYRAEPLADGGAGKTSAASQVGEAAETGDAGE